MLGHIKFFLAEKGYGYIRVAATYEEFFFQQKDLKSPVAKGDSVQFKLKEDRHGVRAVDILLVAQS
ncbi:MAG: cold shock domain-containing protein [Bacteroidota bacterium]